MGNKLVDKDLAILEQRGSTDLYDLEHVFLNSYYWCTCACQHCPDKIKQALLLEKSLKCYSCKLFKRNVFKEFTGCQLCGVILCRECTEQKKIACGCPSSSDDTTTTTKRSS